MQRCYIKFDHIFAYKWASFGPISVIFVPPHQEISETDAHQINIRI
jgi:hypothetical protein